MKEQGIGNVVFAAMSHAFFTLGLGIGSMEIFGSYLSKDCKLTGESINVVILDTVVALTAGIIIILHVLHMVLTRVLVHHFCL